MAKFEQILDECIERMLQGESLKDCLESYPEYAQQLEPLLRTAAVAKQATGLVQARPEFKARLRYEVASRMRASAKPAATKSPFLGWAPRWAVAIVSVCLLLVLAGGSTVAAASSSVPGDSLYSVKTTSEKMWLAVALSDGAKARLQARFAQRRVGEMAQLIQRGETGDLRTLSAKLDTHLDNLSGLAAEIREANPDSSQIAQLEQMLESNMAKDLALLDAVESITAPETWPAIELARKRLANSYQGTFDALAGNTEEFSGDGNMPGPGGSGGGGYGSMPGPGTN